MAAEQVLSKVLLHNACIWSKFCSAYMNAEIEQIIALNVKLVFFVNNKLLLHLENIALIFENFGKFVGREQIFENEHTWGFGT